MTRRSIKLKVASPCDANWEGMTGDEAKRFCKSCEKDVYQLSNMSQDAVEALLEGGKGLRICARFYQRADGTLLTSDCSVGLAKKRKQRVVKSLGAAAIAVSALGVNQAMHSRARPMPAQVDIPVAQPLGQPDPMPYLGRIQVMDPEPEPLVYETMGEVQVEDFDEVPEIE